MVGCIDQVKKTLPETIEQRILVNIENKKIVVLFYVNRVKSLG